ncbi:MAG: site-2 protease family protein [Deltaproteobacteria bacterium]|nr:site-2 protease family protein [Deltaproteobacteria bacterium]MBW2047067.1 site-2 protease family protein [Deltaproteobacteria bacterium]MBW2110504.1 site-2 protease family protein [Deltaproteobacteria bacterium]MBW2351608.1 site-2 protease family protein [Deltaproteobacteria bacterium]HDZ89384.1 site-2 protease family protein [Deltaproteobacteria bacterium]
MPFDITYYIVKIPVLLFAITVHEYAHGRAALSLGDPTAKQMGRLTLNPLPHIDPVGAICLFLFNFGWAKPVPVDIRYFRNTRRDIVIMALAGPLANICVAFLAGLLIRFLILPFEIYLQVLLWLILMNLGLGIFNLLPLPPLDGSHVLENILPPAAALKYRVFRRYGPLILIGVILLDNFAHTGIISRILIGPMLYLAHLFAGDNLFFLLPLLRQ